MASNSSISASIAGCWQTIHSNNGKINTLNLEIDELTSAKTSLSLVIGEHYEFFGLTNAADLCSGFDVQLNSCEGLGENGQSYLHGQFVSRIGSRYEEMSAYISDIIEFKRMIITNLRISNTNLRSSISSLNQQLADI
jgi:hypothetical protein